VPTKSEAIERRRALADWRRGPQILERSQAVSRLQEIDRRLHATGKAAEPIPYTEGVFLELEAAWLKFTLQIVNTSQRVEEINTILERVKQENPEFYDTLHKENGTGEIPLVQIRRRATLPPRLADRYFTKRP